MSEAEDFAEIYGRTREAGYSPETAAHWLRYIRLGLQRRLEDQKDRDVGSRNCPSGETNAFKP